MARSTRKTTSVATRKSSALSPAAAALSAELDTLHDSIGSVSTNKISLKNKKFTFPDGTSSESIDVVVLDFVDLHAYYDEDYDSNNPTPPICFAIGRVVKEMAPHPNSPEPQSTACDGCQWDVFGSGRGNAKACKNRRRLAVLPVDATADTPIMTLEIPPTSIRSWDGIVNKLLAKPNKEDREHYVTKVMEVTMDEGMEQSSPRFKIVDETNPNLEVMLPRREEAKQMIEQPYDYSARNADTKKPASRAGKARTTRRRS